MLPDEALVRTSAVGFASGYRWTARRSTWGQLLWASRGAISATACGRVWVIPAGRSLWIPPETANDVLMQGRGILRSVYLAPRFARRLHDVPRLLRMPPLLGQLIRRAFEHDVLRTDERRHRQVAVLLREELRDALNEPPEPMELPLPDDVRALRAANVMLSQPGVSLHALQLPRAASASRRTLERLFLAQTGLTLGAWYQRNALMHGLRQMAEGLNVAQAALAAGYSGSSAFVFACRRLTGMTPAAMARGATEEADGQ